MFVGFSTCKDTDKRDQTVGAFVCSTNAKATSWFSQVSYHKTFEEMSSNFTANFKSNFFNFHLVFFSIYYFDIFNFNFFLWLFKVDWKLGIEKTTVFPSI